MRACREITNRKSIFPLHPTGEPSPKSGIPPRSRAGSAVVPALPPLEPLSSPVLVPELLELVEPSPVDAAGAVVASGDEPKPVWPMGDAWQAVASKSARVFRVATARTVAQFRPRIYPAREAGGGLIRKGRAVPTATEGAPLEAPALRRGPWDAGPVGPDNAVSVMDDPCVEPLGYEVV